MSENILPQQFQTQHWLKELKLFDWLFAVATLVGCVYTYDQYAAYMDEYEVGILFGTAISLVALGWMWKNIFTHDCLPNLSFIFVIYAMLISIARVLS